jgi:hypothetical protein
LTGCVFAVEPQQSSRTTENAAANVLLLLLLLLLMFSAGCPAAPVQHLQVTKHQQKARHRSTCT